MIQVPAIRTYRCITRRDPVYVLFEDLEVTLVYARLSDLTDIDDYDTPLAGWILSNQAGDCFE